MDPNNAIPHHLLGQAYRDLGRLADAEKQWRQALVEQPNYEPAWRGLADQLNAQERWIEAKELAKAAAPFSKNCLCQR